MTAAAMMTNRIMPPEAFATISPGEVGPAVADGVGVGCAGLGERPTAVVTSTEGTKLMITASPEEMCRTSVKSDGHLESSPVDTASLWTDARRTGVAKSGSGRGGRTDRDLRLRI